MKWVFKMSHSSVASSEQDFLQPITIRYIPEVITHNLKSTFYIPHFREKENLEK